MDLPEFWASGDECDNINTFDTGGADGLVCRDCWFKHFVPLGYTPIPVSKNLEWEEEESI